MSPARKELNIILDGMAEEDILLFLNLAKRLAPDPDDILTEEDIADIQAARMAYQNGETVDHEDIDWD